jgi:hypothetical protein
MTKYQRWHDWIISSAKKRRSGAERHHIIPRCVGGNDRVNNVVRLSYREHFLVHWLLTKIYTSGPARRKIQLALIAMSRQWPMESRNVQQWQKRVCRRRAVSLKQFVEKDLRNLPSGWTRSRDEIKNLATEFLHSREGHKQIASCE